MKAATLFGLCVILAVVCGTQAGKHCGMKACKKYMHEPTEDQKAMFKECFGGASGTSDDEDKKMKMFKMASCIVTKTKIVDNGKFMKATYDSDIDKRFKDAEKAALVKKETETCLKDGDDCSDDTKMGAAVKCMWEAMAKACKGDDAE